MLEEDRKGSRNGYFFEDLDGKSYPEHAFLKGKARYRNSKAGRLKNSVKGQKKSQQKQRKHSRALQIFDTHEYLYGVDLGDPLRLQGSQASLKNLDSARQAGYYDDDDDYGDEPLPREEYFRQVGNTQQFGTQQSYLQSNGDTVPLPIRQSNTSIQMCLDELSTLQTICNENDLPVQNCINVMKSAVDAVSSIRDDINHAKQPELDLIVFRVQQVMGRGVDALGRMCHEEKEQLWDEVMDQFQRVLEEILNAQRVFAHLNGKHLNQKWVKQPIVQPDFSDAVELLAQQLWLMVLKRQDELLVPENVNPDEIFVHSVQIRAKALKGMWKKGFELVQSLASEWSQFKLIFTFQWAVILRKAAIQMEFMQHSVSGWEQVENSPFLRSDFQVETIIKEDAEEDKVEMELNGEFDEQSNENQEERVALIEERSSSSTEDQFNSSYAAKCKVLEEEETTGILPRTPPWPKPKKFSRNSVWSVPMGATSPIPSDKSMQAHAWLIETIRVLFQEAGKVAQIMEVAMDSKIPPGQVLVNAQVEKMMEELQCTDLPNFLADFRFHFSQLAITSLGCVLALSTTASSLAFWALQKLEEHQKQCLGIVKSYDNSYLGINRVLNQEAGSTKTELEKSWSQSCKVQVRKLQDYYYGVWNALFRTGQLIRVRTKTKEQPIPIKKKSPKLKTQNQQMPKISGFVQEMWLSSSFKEKTLPSKPIAMMAQKQGIQSRNQEAGGPPRSPGSPQWGKNLQSNSLNENYGSSPFDDLMNRNFMAQAGPPPPTPSLEPSPFADIMKKPEPKLQASQVSALSFKPAPSPFVGQWGPAIFKPQFIDDSATEASDITASTAVSNSSCVQTQLVRDQSSTQMSKELEEEIELLKQQDEFWNCKIEDLHILEQINHGGFAWVYLGRWEPSSQEEQNGVKRSQEVAFKHIDLSRENGVEEHVVRQFIKEAILYQQIGSHENVMDCHGVIIQLDRDIDVGNNKMEREVDAASDKISNVIPSNGLRLGLLLEYCEVSTLMELIKCARNFYIQNTSLQRYNQNHDWSGKRIPPKAPNDTNPAVKLYFSWRMRLDLAVQIAKGLKHIHECNVVHRDLTSYNVMLKYNKDKSKLVCKVGDFNLSKAIQGDFTSFSLDTNSPEWLANELVCGQEKNFYRESDVFSLGVILWELVTLKLPWRDEIMDMRYARYIVIRKKMDDERLELTREKIYGVPLCMSTFDDLQALIYSCWNKIEKARPSLDEFIRIVSRLRDTFEEDDNLS